MSDGGCPTWDHERAMLLEEVQSFLTTPTRAGPEEEWGDREAVGTIKPHTSTRRRVDGGGGPLFGIHHQKKKLKTD